MAKKRDSDQKDRKLQGEKAVSRRDFVKTGAAAGVGVAAGVAAVLSTSGTALSQVSPADAIQWNYEADVVVIGAGCTGLPAAIRARDLGASVIVVDQNFDPGGKMLHSGGTDLSWRRRSPPAAGHRRRRRQGRVRHGSTAAHGGGTDRGSGLPVQGPHRLVGDGRRGAGPLPLQRTRPPSRLCRQLLRHPGIPDGELRPLGPHIRHARQWRHVARQAGRDLPHGRSDDGHQEGNGLEAGCRNRGRELEPLRATAHGATEPRSPARALARTAPHSRGRLEFSAREKGVQFILNRHMDEIIREQQFSGRVVGIRASYSPRFDPQTGARLESLWQNGNVDDRTETIYIRARKAIIIGAGGHGANPQFRSMFYPAWREPAFVSSGWALLGPRGQDASGIIAGMRVGANLAGMQQNLSYGSTFHFPGILATRDPYTDMLPGHPTFSLRGSTGINLATDSFQHLIVVNQVGKRFFNELLITDRKGGAAFPAGPAKGQPKSGLDHVQLRLAQCERRKHQGDLRRAQ